MARSGYSAISSYSRVTILHLLQERPRRSISELCAATDLHANTVREHLQRLGEAGYVVAETERRTTRGRPRVLYSAATGEDAASSAVARDRVRAAAERGDLMRRVIPDSDGGALSEDAVHQLDALIDDLGSDGFDPVVDERALTVDLSPCSYAASQPEQRGRLCSVHLGLMQGVLTEAGGPLVVDGMLPACDPTQCIVQLASR
ncbi:helix-turn-helix transcriptional regulator [Microbacterium sp. ASV49]|uniref:ArsR family transcriptional regulator n=1 Tax=Microbacterium candidum TaxID=3041922 RepID=A0ABT7N2J1_9MICO|nr:ArsR family transcriptional regulator [Microbacterium sp. ASV49]MDL9980928.1 ArsR family transcriptional regulator [Microbacterium sp. ASV49]